MGIQSFEQLDVWKRAHTLVLDVYRITEAFPASEKYGLVSQMRRAAVSVPANIAEGFKRRGPRDKNRFYNFAQGSLEELRYYFILSRDLKYDESSQSHMGSVQDLARMLSALSRSTRP